MPVRDCAVLCRPVADDAQLASFHALPPALLRHRFVNQLAQLREKVGLGLGLGLGLG